MNKYFKKIKSLRRKVILTLKKIPKLRIILQIGIFLLGINLTINFGKVIIDQKQNAILWAIWEAMVVFFEHSWIEILSAALIYYLLERRLGEVPDNVGKRRHNIILDNFKKAQNKIRILDTSIDSFLIDGFEKSLEEALKSPGLEIEILLLHPDTFAANQRSKDLTNETKDILETMKEGIGKLYNIVQSIEKETKNKNRITVKLFKATPIMMYASWDDKANIGWLPPQDLADKKNTFYLDLRTDLGRYFIDYFESLWGNDRYFEDKKLVLWENYLFVKIIHEDKLIENIFWGGATEDHETPKYITTKDDNILNQLFGKDVRVIHDGIESIATIKRKFTESENSWDDSRFALQQIKITYGNVERAVPRNPIYEIRYIYDKVQIKLNDPNFVFEKLEKNGYAFVSHKHYDIHVNKRMRNHMQKKVYVFENLLEVEPHEEDTINKLQSEKKIQKPYKNNPRKRLYAVFKCELIKGKIKLKIQEEENIYPGEFYIKVNGQKYGETENRKLPTTSHSLMTLEGKREIYNGELNILKQELESINKTLKNNNDSDEIKQIGVDIEKIEKAIKEKTEKINKSETGIDALKCFHEEIESTIKISLLYILGLDRYINSTTEFIAYVHLVRTWVSKESQSAEPTPQEYNKLFADYHVVFLGERENIVGGMSHIKYEEYGKETKFHYRLLLEHPFDGVFYKKTITTHEKKRVDIKHMVEEIRLNNDDDFGYRDVLVVEFKEKL